MSKVRVNELQFSVHEKESHPSSNKNAANTLKGSQASQPVSPLKAAGMPDSQ
jgi:hypothetical protein